MSPFYYTVQIKDLDRRWIIKIGDISCLDSAKQLAEFYAHAYRDVRVMRHLNSNDRPNKIMLMIIDGQIEPLQGSLLP